MTWVTLLGGPVGDALPQSPGGRTGLPGLRGAGGSATDHRSFLCARANEKEEQTCQASHSLPP